MPSLLRGVQAEEIIIRVGLQVSLCSEHLATCNVCMKMCGVKWKTLRNNIVAWLIQLNNWP